MVQRCIYFQPPKHNHLQKKIIYNLISDTIFSQFSALLLWTKKNPVYIFCLIFSTTSMIPRAVMKGTKTP